MDNRDQFGRPARGQRTRLLTAIVEAARRRLRRLAGCVSPDLLRDISSELNIEESADGAA